MHEGKDFILDFLVRYTTSAPVIVMVLKGKNAIEVARKMMGATFGSKAEPGTIRGDYAVSNRFNLIHGSDSLPLPKKKSASFFFLEEELFEYNLQISNGCTICQRGTLSDQLGLRQRLCLILSFPCKRESRCAKRCLDSR